MVYFQTEGELDDAGGFSTSKILTVVASSGVFMGFGLGVGCNGFQCSLVGLMVILDLVLSWS